MKRICMFLIALGIIMGYAPSVKASSQESKTTEDDVTIYTDYGSGIDCKINQIYYYISLKKKCATATWAAPDAPSVVKIPSSVTLDGVNYPVTKFDNTILNYPSQRELVERPSFEEIKLPDSVLKVVFSFRPCKKINIPKHAKASLDLDIDDTAVEIPADHDYYALKDNFVYDKKDATKIYYVLGASGNVRIPKGVKYVGRLLQNSRIEKLSLPSTLEEIGTKFACEANALKTVNLSETKLKMIPAWAFRWTSSLKKVEFPSTLLGINVRAFEGSGLKKVVIPNKVTDIGGGAFEFCYDLKKVSLGKKVKRIYSYAFAWTAIQEITIPASVEKMDDLLFCDTKNLRKVTLLHKKKMARFSTRCFWHAPSGIKFYVKNQKMAKQLKKKLKKSKVKKAKIYVGKKKKPVYKNING